MNLTIQDTLSKLYNYYPVGGIEIEEEYEKTDEFEALEKKINDKINAPFWHSFLNKISAIYNNRIRDLTILNTAAPPIVNAANPCFIFSFDLNIANGYDYETIFYLSAIEDFYCFSIKKMPSELFDETYEFFDANLEKLKGLNRFEKHDFLNEEIGKRIVNKIEITWNKSFPESQSDISIITNTIEKNSTYKLFNEDYLFEIVPNVTTLNNPKLNTSTFFNCLFGNILEHSA